MHETAAASSAGLLSSSDAAKLLGVSRRTVALWAELGELPAFKVGRNWKFQHEAIKEWLSRRSNEALRTSASAGGRTG